MVGRLWDTAKYDEAPEGSKTTVEFHGELNLEKRDGKWVVVEVVPVV